MNLESEFRVQVIDRIKERFPLMDLDFIKPVHYTRSLPDLFIIAPNNVWAALELKRIKNADHQPNQDWHIARLDTKGFARVVYPGNLEEILDELEELFASQEHSRISIPF